MSASDPVDLLKRAAFCQVPAVDGALAALATAKADVVRHDGEGHSTEKHSIFINAAQIEHIRAAYAAARANLPDTVSLSQHFAIHCIRCFLEQPNKALVLRAILRDDKLNDFFKDSFTGSLETCVTETLWKALEHCDDMILLQRSLWILSLLGQEIPAHIRETLFELAQGQSRGVLRSRSAFRTILASCQTSLISSSYHGSKAYLSIEFEFPFDVTNPFVSSGQGDGFGAATIFLPSSANAKKAVKNISAEILQSAFNSLGEMKGNKPEVCQVESDSTSGHNSVNVSVANLLQTLTKVQSTHFCMHSALADFLETTPIDAGVDSIDNVCSPCALLHRFAFVQHLLWANRHDVHACALAMLHARDETFLFSVTHHCPKNTPSQALSTVLNAYCILEDYFALPSPILMTWASESSTISSNRSTRFFNIQLLLHLANCPDSIGGDLVTIVLLALLTDMFSRLHTLDIEIVDRFRFLLVYLIHELSYAFPWEAWHAMTSVMADARVLVCRKIFLFEVLRDLADLSFPHRIRDAIPSALHGFVPSLKAVNRELIPKNEFRDIIRTADCMTARELYKKRIERFQEHSAAVQLLDGILRVSDVSLSYQKQLLRAFHPAFSEFLRDTVRGDEAHTAQSEVHALLDHVYRFWTNNHANRLQSLYHLLDVGIVDCASVPQWLESACIAGVWEQSWVRHVLVHAAHLTLQRWKKVKESRDSTEDPISDVPEATQLRSFFHHAFLVLQRKITSLVDTEEDEIATFTQSSAFSEQPRPHWSGRNVLLLHSAVGLLRWLIRLYFIHRIPTIFRSQESQIREIVFAVGPCHDFLAKLWRESVVLFGCFESEGERKALEKECTRLDGEKHAAYRRYCARKMKQQSK